MGLGSSQVRLLSLYAEKNNLSGRLIHFANEKESLAREMQSVSKAYQNALSAKVLKMSFNSGVDYTDITYSTLMRPGAATNNTQYILTNNSGKVILDSKYKKYAQKFSPDGKVVGDWSQHRNEIISELTGISVSDLENANASSKTVQDKFDKYCELENEKSKYKGKEKYTKETYPKIVKLLDGDLSKGGKKTVKTAAELKTITDNIYNSLSKYLIDKDTHTLLQGQNTRQEFKDACDNFVKTYGSVIEENTEAAKKQRDASDGLFSGKAGKVEVDISKLVEHLVSQLQKDAVDSNGDNVYFFRDTTSDEWKNWYSELQAKDDAVNGAYKEYQEVLNTDNQIFTSAQERQIEYYDKLFTAIAENGWVEDLGINEPEYLNQMLQNNEYVLMTMVENADYVENKADLGYNEAHTKHKYDYSMDIALNCDNIFAVNDSELKQQALVEYENKKYIIQAKESKVDQQQKNAETSMSAIVKMIQGIESQIKDNTDWTFNIFT